MAKPILVKVDAHPEVPLFSPATAICICGLALRVVVGGGTARCHCGQAFEAVYR